MNSPKYSVKYEIKAYPDDVIVEIICKDEEEAKAVYEDRLSRGTLKNVKIKIRNNT